VIIDTTKGKMLPIGEMDRPSAKELVFDNAVYLHRGNQYLVTNLDIENRRCYVEESDVNYYTDAVVKTDIKILQQDRDEGRWGVGVVVGDVLVRSQVTKFKKLKFNTHENLGYGEISLPEEEMHTRSVVLVFRGETRAGRAFQELPIQMQEEVVSDIGTLVKNVAPIFLLCAPSDLGVAERLKDPHLREPALFVYDRYPGGTGLSEGFIDRIGDILRGALELIELCQCEAGCPSCIGAGPPIERSQPSIDPETGKAVNRKQVVEDFLRTWLDAGEDG
jgi:DEAD/DEAH box helicase domain-containing protein